MKIVGKPATVSRNKAKRVQTLLYVKCEHETKKAEAPLVVVCVRAHACLCVCVCFRCVLYPSSLTHSTGSSVVIMMLYIFPEYYIFTYLNICICDICSYA